MTDTFRQFFGFSPRKDEIEALGEDMAPAPSALAQHSELSAEKKTPRLTASGKPFASKTTAPLRDF